MRIDGHQPVPSGRPGRSQDTTGSKPETAAGTTGPADASQASATESSSYAQQLRKQFQSAPEVRIDAVEAARAKLAAGAYDGQAAAERTAAAMLKEFAQS